MMIGFGQASENPGRTCVQGYAALQQKSYSHLCQVKFWTKFSLALGLFADLRRFT